MLIKPSKIEHFLYSVNRKTESKEEERLKEPNKQVCI